MYAKLLSSASSPPEWEIELQEFPVVIGTSPDAGIQPADRWVSDWHCEIEEVDGLLMVRDLGSEKGTFVNDSPIAMAPLLPGDKLTVGETSFVAAYEPTPPINHSVPRLWDDGERSLVDCGDRAEMTFFDLVTLLERQRNVFRMQYKRDLGQEVPMFPDPPHPEHLEHLIVQEMRMVGVGPQFIFAFEKTGILVTEHNYDSISEHELTEWHAAIEEYLDRDKQGKIAQRYPVGAVTMFGPDKSVTTMIVAAVMTDVGAKPIHRRWAGSSVRNDVEVKKAIAEFFLAHGVRSVIHVHENVGCPHQEGIDYPVGGDCPLCPYWKGKQEG